MEYLCTVVWSNGASTKLAPSTDGGNLHTWNYGDTFYASDIIRDVIDPNNPLKLWAKISQGEFIGKYVAVSYPTADPANYIRCTYEQVGVIPGVTLTHTIDVYSDGSLVIDGIPYQ